ncbi:DNA-processing protein DprA [Hymenobacter tenuis]
MAVLNPAYTSTYQQKHRYRIIAGLSDGTVVVEAARKGGALITADLAQGYDRDVLAVPGPLGSPASEGCHELIKANKAALYSEPKDLEELLNWDAALHLNGKFKTPTAYLADDFTPEEFSLITVLQAAPNREEHLDTLSWKAQVPVYSSASVLLGLEFRGVVKALPGKRFALV